MSAPAPARLLAVPDGALVAEALADLRADFDELLFLVRAAEASLALAAAELAEAPLHARTRATLEAQIRGSRSRYGAIGRRLLALRQLAGGNRETAASLLAELTDERAAFGDLLRAEQALAGALAGAADWQSPSFLHSTRPAAGRQFGRITPHWNDYKRDRHLDADAYEQAYAAQMVDGPAGLRALLTSCGMAAFTTILASLRLEGRLVVVGRGLYHETRLLLERALPGRVRAVDERETGRLLAAIDRLRPAAVFLDSLSNTKWMPVPDLRAVTRHLDGSDTVLVVDNTGLSVACQPFALAPEGTRLLVWESLLKYAQLGLDRVNAGVIVARVDDADALAAYREHLGTNVGDVAVHTLPQPDRRILDRRLARLWRNAALLAERLACVARVVYPQRGGCLSLVPGRGREEPLVEAAVAEAARRGVALIGGSSFGFDTTRIYLTAEGAELGEPFVRVAAGTEHRLDVERLAEALVAAVRAVA